MQEVWEIEVVPGANWNAVSDYLRKQAVATKKRNLVIDAYGLRSDVGDPRAFNTAYFVTVFESLADRNAYWREGLNDEQMSLYRDQKESNLTADRMGHYYFNVLA